MTPEVDTWIDGAIGQFTEDLVAFCRFPSEATEAQALANAAGWIDERCRRGGARVETITLPDRPDVPPLVVAEYGDGPRTLNCVQHYDVQPAHPVELWTSPPYDSQIRDGTLYARGATDNKGELLTRLLGVEAYLATTGTLPCRVRFLIEGEEEHGSPNLGPLLDRRPALRTADGALIEGGGLDPEDRPTIDCGVRGMLAVEMTARTLTSDVHSAAATVVDSAAVRLVAALATLHGPDGAVTIDGFLDDVRPPSHHDRAAVRALPLDDLEVFKTAYGARRYLKDMDGPDAQEAAAFDPTANIQALWAGYTGAGSKNVVTAEARARLDLRLVPDQSPEGVSSALRAHLDRRGFDDVAFEWIEMRYRPWWTPMDDPLVLAAVRASEAVTGKSSLVSPSMGGTAPMHEVCAEYDVPCVTLGSARTDCMAHAPDENFRIADAAIGAKITARFLEEFAKL
jgi:acetylornithine deacetylase/succinyl-diaminopimelate desuccinylase-like protein